MMYQPKVYKLQLAAEEKARCSDLKKYGSKGYYSPDSYQTKSETSSNKSASTDCSKKSTVIYVDENGNECKEPVVRRIARAQARHVTVVSYSRRQKESHSHTSHHVTTVR